MKFPAFMELEGSPPCSQRAHHFSLSLCKNNPVHSHYILSGPFLRLSSHLGLRLACGLIPSDFPTTTLYAFLLPLPRTLHATSHPTWFVHPSIIWVMNMFRGTSSVAFLPIHAPPPPTSFRVARQSPQLHDAPQHATSSSLTLRPPS
jgi:hypothetical protein